MKLTPRISLGFFGISLAIAAAAIVPTYSIARRLLLQEVEARLLSSAQSRRSHVQTYLGMLRVSLLQLSRSVVMEDFLRALEARPRACRREFLLAQTRLRRTREVNANISEFLLLDAGGKVVASSRGNSLGADLSANAFFIGGREAAFFKDAYRSEALGQDLLAVSAPMRDSRSGRLLGVLAARVRLEALDRIMTDRTGQGETGELYLVNKYGYMITPSRFREGTFLKQKVDTPNFRLSVLQSAGVPGAPGPRVVFGPDYRGQEVIGAREYIPELQWHLLAEVDADEALAPLARFRGAAVLILLAAGLLSWLMGRLFARRITRPIHALHEGTERISQGDLDFRVGTAVPDEIGQLSRAFDSMAESLQRSTTSIAALNAEAAERKAAQAEASRLSREWQDTFDAMPDLISIHDREFRIVRANRAFQDSFARVEGGVLGRKCYELVHALEGPPPDCPHLETLATGNGVVRERYEPRLGIQLEVSTSPIFGPGGEVVGSVHMARDVTARKAMEEALRKHGRQFSCLHALATIVEKSSSLEELFEKTVTALPQGFSRHETVRARILFRGQRYQAADHPEAAARETADIMAQGQRVGSVELCRVDEPPGTQTGPLFSGELPLLHMVAERLGRVVERHDAQAELAFKNALMSAQQEASLDGILTVGPGGQVLSCNQRFAGLWRMPPSVLASQDDGRLLSWAAEQVVESEPFLRKVRQLSEQRDAVSRDELALKDGRFFDRYSAPVLGPGGRHYGRIWYFRDVTELRRAEQFRKDTVAMTTHELRSPLTAIRSSLHLLEAEAASLPETARTMLSIAARNSDRMIRMVKSYLDLEKIESGRMEFKPQPLELMPVVEDALRLNEAVAAQAGARFALAASAPGARVMGSADHLLQVLTNLLANAVKFSPPGGCVEVSVARRGPALRVAVKDQGPGVPAEFRGRVFQKFAQGPGGKDQGTGLGLCISKAIVEALGGRIGFDNNPGQGATFFFELPVLDERASAAS